MAAANTAIEPAAERMKADHPIRIDRNRTRAPFGGDWEALDPVAQGRVQVLPVRRAPIAQAQAAMAELQRLSTLTPDWDWSASAVIARKWKYLEPVRAWCETQGVPVQMGNEQIPNFWRLRETEALRNWLRRLDSAIVDLAALRQWLAQQSPSLGSSCCTKPPMNSPWKPAARNCRRPTASSGWRSGAGRRAAANADCCC